MKNRS